MDFFEPADDPFELPYRKQRQVCREDTGLTAVPSYPVTGEECSVRLGVALPDSPKKTRAYDRFGQFLGFVVEQTPVPLDTALQQEKLWGRSPKVSKPVIDSEVKDLYNDFEAPYTPTRHPLPRRAALPTLATHSDPTPAIGCSLLDDPEFEAIKAEIEEVLAKQKEALRKEKERLEAIEREKKRKEEEARKLKEAAEKKKKEEEEKKKKAEEEAKAKAEPKTESPVASPSPTKPVASAGAAGAPADVVVVDPWAESFVRPLVAAKYLLAETDKLKADPSLKEMRSHTMKFVTRAMNLCSSNQKSIKEAAVILLQGLHAQGNDPKAPQLQFTAAFVGSQFIEQAQTQIHRNPKSAWAFGTLLRYIHDEVHHLYDIIIGVILLDNPCAIPIFHNAAISKNEWIGKAAPKRAELGEKEVARLLSICKLYWASLVRGNDADAIWRLWSRVLQCDLPIGLIVAPALIEVTGNYLSNTFPKQGPKLIYYLRNNSFATWKSLATKKNATEPEKMQLTKLGLLFDDITKHGKFAAPEGMDMDQGTTS